MNFTNKEENLMKQCLFNTTCYLQKNRGSLKANTSAFVSGSKHFVQKAFSFLKAVSPNLVQLHLLF